MHIIVMAAGNSRRFGENKLLYPYKGKPLYQHLLDTLDDISFPEMGERVLVSRYEEILTEASLREYRAESNNAPEAGISYSVCLGLRAVLNSDKYEPGDSAMFLVCDQPKLSAETLEHLAQEYLASDKGIGCVRSGKRLGNPVIFRDDYWGELQRLTGEQGGKSVLHRYPDDVMTWETPNGWELQDIDTLKDTKPLIIIRGGGDLATGTAHRLCRGNYRVLVLETKQPACIRRQVSFCEAVYEGDTEVDGIVATRVKDRTDIGQAWQEGKVPVAVDAKGLWIQRLHPDIVVDAILAKKNLGTRKDMAELVIALGPGFEAGQDADVVIETMRGEHLGKIYRKGCAIPNTGIPGVIAGAGKERVIHAPTDGKFRAVKQIGEVVEQGETLARIENKAVATSVYATIRGILRGQIREGYPVKRGLKIMDIEPRTEERERCFHISDKAACIGESVYKVVKAYEDSRAKGQSYGSDRI